MMTKGAPVQLARDQPALKVIFALRDPVERAHSEYRFLFSAYEGKGKKKSFDAILSKGVQLWWDCLKEVPAFAPPPPQERESTIAVVLDFPDKGLHNVRLSLDLLTDIFFDKGDTYPAACRAAVGAKKVSRGLYAPQVWHWMRRFGRDNVKVVTLEEIKDRPAPEVMNELYDFLGLCRGSGVVTADDDGEEGLVLPQAHNRIKNRSPQQTLPSEYEMSSGVFEALHELFAPMNEMLFELVEQEFPYGAAHFRDKYGFSIP